MNPSPHHHHTTPPSTHHHHTLSYITGPTGDVISRDESLERDADAHNDDTFGDDYINNTITQMDDNNNNNDYPIMSSYIHDINKGSIFTRDEDEEEEKDQANEDEEDGVGSRHHYHYQTGLRMSPIVGSSHTTQTNNDGLMMRMMMMHGPPGIILPSPPPTPAPPPPPPPGIVRRPSTGGGLVVDVVSNQSITPHHTTPSEHHHYPIRPPPGIHLPQQQQHHDVTPSAVVLPSTIPPLLGRGYDNDDNKMMVKQQSGVPQRFGPPGMELAYFRGNTTTTNTSSSTASRYDGTSFTNTHHGSLMRKGRGYPIPLTSYHRKKLITTTTTAAAAAVDGLNTRSTADIMQPAYGQYSSSSSSSSSWSSMAIGNRWMTDDEKDMVMKSQLNQMAQLNTGVQDRKGKFIFNNNNNNNNSSSGSTMMMMEGGRGGGVGVGDATPNDEMLSNPSTRFLGNKVYSSIQHPRRNLTLTSSRKETGNNNNKSSDHTYNNNDDDPRKIIEDGLLQMMDIDICDNNLSVLHPMAIDRIVHTLDTRVHLLHNIIQELLRFSGGKETAVAALVGYRKGRLLIQRLCTALQYVLLPPHDDAQCSCSSSDAGNDVLNNDNTNSHHHDHHHHGVGDSMMIMRGRGRTLSLLQNKDEVTHRQEHRIQTLLSTIEDTIRWEHLTYPCYNMLTILSSMLHCITRQKVVPVNDDDEWGDMLHTLERSNIIIGSISSSFTK